MSDHTVVRWKGDEFCWKCRITTLEAENKALREQFSRDMDFANKSYGDLKTENKALRKAAKAVMKGCTRCWGKVTYSGRDFESCVCTYCQTLSAALTKEEL